MVNKLELVPEVDLFASRVNKQVESFFSFRPDPDCLLVDTFTAYWGGTQFYAFPPFNCLPRTLQKICFDEAKGILTVPDWPNQPWYDQFIKLAERIIDLEPGSNLLRLPQKPELKHPLWRSLRLKAGLIQGNLY